MDTIVNLLVSLNQLFGNQLGITLIVLGVGVRLAFNPLIKSQLAHAKKMQELQPKMKELKNLHGEDKAKLAQAQSDLFKEAGINPAAGCLPLVAQIVVFGVLYNAISKLFERGIPTQFLWWDLGKPDLFNIGLPFALPGALVLFAALSQLVMSKMMMPHPVPVERTDKPKEVEEKVDLAEDISRMQGQMIYMFPLMFISFGYQLPAGLSLYWSASTVMSLIQQYRVNGWGGMEEWMGKIKN